MSDREREVGAIQYIIDQMDPAKVYCPPEEVHIGEGDVMLWKECFFVGTYKRQSYKDYITARLNSH